MPPRTPPRTPPGTPKKGKGGTPTKSPPAPPPLADVEAVPPDGAATDGEDLSLRAYPVSFLQAATFAAAGTVVPYAVAWVVAALIFDAAFAAQVATVVGGCVFLAFFLVSKENLAVGIRTSLFLAIILAGLSTPAVYRSLHRGHVFVDWDYPPVDVVVDSRQCHVQVKYSEFGVFRAEVVWWRLRDSHADIR